MPFTQIFTRLKDSVVSLNEGEVTKATQDALKDGVLPQDIISEGLGKGMEVIGERFERREFFLPELMLSAKVMKSALDILRPHLVGGGHHSAGKVVLGTVQGDVHYIGKNIVGAVLEGDGFEVYDLGEDVPPENFVKKAQEVKADIVGISALISVAVSKMSETISVLKENKIPVKVIVGGAAVTQDAVRMIGADTYGKDAWSALQEIRELIKGRSLQ